MLKRGIPGDALLAIAKGVGDVLGPDEIPAHLLNEVLAAKVRRAR